MGCLPNISKPNIFDLTILDPKGYSDKLCGEAMIFLATQSSYQMSFISSPCDISNIETLRIYDLIVVYFKYRDTMAQAEPNAQMLSA